MIIGVTGGIASGKSYVSRLLKEKGFEHIDADFVCRKIISDNADAKEEIVELLGNDILNSDGSLNRAKISSKVFSDASLLQRYNEIVQKRALSVCLNKIDHCRKNSLNAVFDVPLLFETGWNRYCDLVIAIACDEKIRLERAIQRGTLSEEDIKMRMKNQMSDEERAVRSDIVINNNSNKSELADNVFKALAKYNI